MHLQKFILSLVLVIYSVCIRAQNSGTQIEDKYTPNQSSIFNNSNKKVDGTSSDAQVEIKNSVKFCPTFAFRQKLVFFYERDLVNGLALNAGIGKAFGKDWLQDTYFAFTDNSSDILDPSDLFSYSQFMKSSAFFLGGLKIYYSGTTFERGYFEVFARHESQTYLLPEAVNGNTILGDREFTFRTTTYGFGIGTTGLTGGKNNITHDFFMQVGVKFIEVPNFMRVVISNGSFNETNYLNTNTTMRLTLIPSINLGYAIGFGW